MNPKLLKTLVGRIFPSENIPALIEIINATPNPEVAVELLCEVYEEPTILLEPSDKFKARFSGYFNFKIINFDKFTNKITFSADVYREYHLWVRKSTPLDEIPTFCTELSEYKSDASHFLGITIDQLEKEYEFRKFTSKSETVSKTNTCYLDSWNGDSK